MKKVFSVVVCLACSLVWADEADETGAEVPEVSTRLAMIEVIDVTAEKESVVSDEALDDEVAAILDEVESLEADDGEE